MCRSRSGRLSAPTALRPPGIGGSRFAVRGGDDGGVETRPTVELVPSTCWYTNVRSKVSKVWWDRLRRRVAAEAGSRCEICGGRGRRWPVECHEVWHYDDDRKIQRLERLAALCPACHEVKHAGLASKRGRLPQVIGHLAAMNGWSESDAACIWRECSSSGRLVAGISGRSTSRCCAHVMVSRGSTTERDPDCDRSAGVTDRRDEAWWRATSVDTDVSVDD